jgi:protein-disulfide isomerase
MRNVWRIVAIILAVLLLISLFFNLRGAIGSRSPQDVGAKTVAIINDQLLPPGNTATVIDSTEESGIYKIDLNIDGTLGTVYVTKDGKYLFTDPIDLTNIPTVPTTNFTNVSIDDAPMEGNISAAVTIVEFSDFECSFCRRFFNETLPELRREYIGTGKVRLVYRNFPLPSHPLAQKAAEAGQCAFEQGMFWEMHDILYQNQNALNVTDLKNYAWQIGLNPTQFDSCLDSGKYAEKIEEDIADGVLYGVRGTPAFFINGEFVSGAQDYEVFQSIIEDKLQNGSQ